jgi:hypothetical protein
MRPAVRRNDHFRSRIFCILSHNETLCSRQNGTFPRAARNGSHSWQSVWRRHAVFGQGQSSLMTGGTGICSTLYYQGA